ncbi:MAG TPA: antitoxin Xre/MbcA/ParS toxin-binding domain-containing protein [Gemmatimonadales bacterium]|nr:antitoxin Xre/MbcA/ParS toxin-binding domain-containing protein [Gemmatimonadales bacterium]
MTVLNVAEKLGGKRLLQREVRTELDLAELVRDGLPARALDRIVEELGEATVSRTDVYAIIGSVRTLQRKLAQRTPLSRDESDRLMRLVQVLVRAEEALGDPVKARRWLVAANRGLRGARPFALLDSDAGVRAVERALGRLEHGVFS